MTKTVCPGQDTRYWRPEDIFDVECGHCGKSVEFFKDEASRRCGSCGERIRNPRLSFGCAQWCEHAKECLGYDPNGVDTDEEGEETLVDQLIAVCRNSVDGGDISGPLAVMENARKLLEAEQGIPKLVLVASLLAGLGLVGSEEEQTRQAAEILKEGGVDIEAAAKIGELLETLPKVGRDSPTETRIVADAMYLSNVEAEKAKEDNFLTEGGLKIFEQSAALP
jgi:hypothetical protein